MESFNHPFGKEACKKRLLEEYKKYGKLIVAFDYDNTIFDYHNNGGDYSCVVNLLRHCTMLGFEMILFSTEEDEDKIIEKQVECVQMRVGNLINDMIIPPLQVVDYSQILKSPIIIFYWMIEQAQKKVTKF